MAGNSNFILRGGADFSDIDKKMKAMQKRMQNFGSKMTSIGKTMSYSVSAPIIAAGAGAFKLASDFEESMNKVNVAFGDNAGVVTAWSKDTLNRFGIAQGTALDMAAGFGDMSTSMGLSTGDAAKMSTEMVGLAGDLASFKNKSIDEVTTSLNGIFTGETESLKMLGVVMTQENLNAYALAKGYKKTVKDMTQAEKVMLRYNYVVDSTKNAQGDFSETSEGAANQMRIFTESVKELGASFGKEILPIITPIIKKINGLIKEFAGLDKGTKELIVKLALFVAAVGPVLTVVGKLTTSMASMEFLFGGVRTAAALAGGATGIGKFGAGLSALIGPGGLIALTIAALGLLAYAMHDAVKENPGLVITPDDKVDKLSAPTDIGPPPDNTLPVGAFKKLAAGGIVTRPTFALVGEAGPEAVIPLNKMNQTVNHTGTITVKGVNDKGELVAIVEQSITNNIMSGNRRLPNRTSLIPI